MKKKISMNRTCCLLVAILLSGSWTACREHNHDHDHGPVQATLRLNDGARWLSDAPTRQGMARLQSRLAAAGRGALVEAEAAALTQAVEDDLNQILAECQMQGEAHDQLHILLGQLFAGLESYRKASSAEKPQALKALADSAAQYDTYFQ